MIAKKKKTNNKDAIKQKKIIEAKLTNYEIDLEDVPLLTDKEVEEMQVEDLHPTMKYDYIDGQWNFKEAYRLMTLMMQWILKSKENCFSNEFYLVVVPKAEEEGKIKRFPGKFLSSETIYNLCDRFPYIKKMYKRIREIQDMKVANKGFDGTWNSGLCQLYLKTHDRENWTEIQKVETTNKTQIISIDPLSEDVKEE